MLYITEIDRDRLSKLILAGRAGADAGYLEKLERELACAQIVGPGEIPPDVVTMNSRLRFTDLDTGEEATYTVVYPQDADIDEGRISVLAPIGTALLGYRAGDVIQWPVPAGLRRLRVDAVLYQPEAVGDYQL